MRKYDQSNPCPKCGARTAGSLYTKNKEKEAKGEVVVPESENIRRQCTNCRFAWDEWPLDSKYLEQKGEPNVFGALCGLCGKPAEARRIGGDKAYRCLRCLENAPVITVPTELIGKFTEKDTETGQLKLVSDRFRLLLNEKDRENIDLGRQINGLKLENKGLQELYNAAITCSGVVSDKQYKDLLAKHDALVEALRNQEKFIETLQIEKTDYVFKIDELKGDILQLQSAKINLANLNTQIHEKLESVEGAHHQVIKQRDQFKASCIDQASVIDTERNRCNHLATQCNVLKKQNAQFEQGALIDRRNLTALQTICDNQATAIKDYRENIDSLKRDLRAASVGKQERDTTILHLEEEIHRLEDTLLKWSDFCDTIRPLLDEIGEKSAPTKKD